MDIVKFLGYRRLILLIKKYKSDDRKFQMIRQVKVVTNLGVCVRVCDLSNFQSTSSPVLPKVPSSVEDKPVV